MSEHRNWAREAQIATKLEDAGVRDSDIEIFLIEHRAGEFDLADITEEWLTQQKVAHPLRFIGGTDAETELHVRAFGLDGNKPSITAQGQIVKACGGDLAAANEIAARYGARIGSLKPGKSQDDDDDDKSKSKNPWRTEPDTPQAQARRMSIIRTSTRMARELSAAAGKTIDNRPLR